MPSPVDAATLLRFSNQAEVTFSDEHPFLVQRMFLPIQAGVSTYTLPDYVRLIKRITYQGTKLSPLPRRMFREAFEGGTQQSKPFWYVFNNIGLNKIQLFPVPNVTLGTASAGAFDSGAFESTSFETTQFTSACADLWNTGIATCCIVEFYRVSDNSTYVIPTKQRRQILKLAVNESAYLVDGSGNNLKLSKYFGERWKQRSEALSLLFDELYSQPRKLILGNTIIHQSFPGQPILPVNQFGIPVDEGY